MYLIVNPTTEWYDFYADDPRDHGYKGTLEENVTFEDLDPVVPEMAPYPLQIEMSLGRSKTNRHHYRAFRTREECVKAGFENLGSEFSRHGSWAPEKD